MMEEENKMVENISEDKKGAVCLIVGIIAMLLMFGMMVLIILSIEKIAFAVVIMGVGLLALGGGVFLLRKGLDKIKI
jgi:hypothetical protein